MSNRPHPATFEQAPALPAHRTVIAILLVLLTGYLANSWVLGRDNYFALDDFLWLRFNARLQWDQIFSLLPTAPYNDRPIGALFLKALYQRLGLDYQRHHAVLLLIHLGNACLVYFVTRRIVALFGFKRIRTPLGCPMSLLAAMIFVAWPEAVTIPTSWEAACFDLLSATFTLVAILFYFGNEPRFSAFDTAFCSIFYVLALRTKEMAVVLPVLCAGLEILAQYPDKGGKWRSYELRFGRLIPMGLILFFYMAAIVVSKDIFPEMAKSESPYFLSFAPVSMLSNVWKYIVLYWDFFQDEDVVTLPQGPGWILPSLFILFLTTTVVLFLWRRVSLPLALAWAAAVQITPVLPMCRMQVRLYLYLPSMFLAMATACGIVYGMDWFGRRFRMAGASACIAFLLGLGLIIVARLKGNEHYRRWWCEVGKANRKAAKAMFKLAPPPKGATVSFINIPPDLRGVGLAEGSGGAFLKFIFADDSVKVDIYEENAPVDLGAITGGPIIDWNKGSPKKIR
jgi:hypothetical protein